MVWLQAVMLSVGGGNAGVAEPGAHVGHRLGAGGYELG